MSRPYGDPKWERMQKARKLAAAAKPQPEPQQANAAEIARLVRQSLQATPQPAEQQAAQPQQQKGATVPESNAASEVNPVERIARAMRETQQQREESQRQAAAAYDPKRDFLGRQNYGPLPADAYSKLGGNPELWPAEARGMSLEHRAASKMPMNPAERIELGYYQRESPRGGS